LNNNAKIQKEKNKYWSMAKKIFLIYAVFLVLFLSPVIVNAGLEIEEKLIYDIKEDGTAHVTIISTTGKNYLWYQTYISGEPIKGTEKTNGEDVEVTVTAKYDFKSRSSYNLTSVKIYFPDSLGTFETELDVKLTEKYGMTYPVSILGLTTGRETEIQIPKSWSEPIRVFPEFVSVSEKNEGYVIYWKNASSTISLQCGNQQAYRFVNKFYFSEFDPAKTILFPADVNYHQGGFGTNSPKPLSISIDEDGNYYVNYDIAKSGYVELIYEANVDYREYDFKKSGFKKDVPEELKKYTKGDNKYWNIDNSDIEEIVKTHTDDSKTIAENAKSLYDYTTNLLRHSNPLVYAFRKKMTTSEIIQSPESGVCIDIANFYITLLRNYGIPARLIVGWSDTGESAELHSSVLHAWVQFYDTNLGWIEVDPTWETTSGKDYFYTFDTNHVVLAILGKSPEYPNVDMFIDDIEAVVLNHKADPIPLSSFPQFEETTTTLNDMIVTTTLKPWGTTTTLNNNTEKKSSILIYIILAVVIVAVVTAVILLFFKRKKEPSNELYGFNPSA